MLAGKQNITAGVPALSDYVKDLYEHRQLLRFFIWRDIVVRYKQAVLGIAWVVIKPLLTMLLFTFIFGLIARFPSENVSYPLFVLAGMLPWQYFANCSNDCCVSLINNSQLITKAYFPRVVLPLSLVTAQLVDLGVNAAIFIVLIPLFGTFPPLTHWLLIPLLIFWAYLFCLGTSIWLAPLTARYRDVRFLVNFVVQFGMFLSPVGYGTFMISADWVPLYALNPMVGLIDAFRWVFLGLDHPLMVWTIAYSLLVTAILLFSGLAYFRKTEDDLVDIL